MAKKAKGKQPSKWDIMHEFQDYRDVASLLTEQYNGWASYTEDFPLLEEDWVLERLQLIYHGEDLLTLMDDEFSRGIVMGQLAIMKTYEVNEDDDDSTEG